MKQIPLPDGRVILVDDDDFHFASRWKWSCLPDPAPNRYPRRSKSIPPWNERRKKHVYLHRELMNAPTGTCVDHIDGNPLNCQKENLRVCTISENNRNRLAGIGKTGLRGVHQKKGRIWAQIEADRTVYRAGPFPSVEAAHEAYRRAAAALHGVFNPFAGSISSLEGFTARRRPMSLDGVSLSLLKHPKLSEE